MKANVDKLTEILVSLTKKQQKQSLAKGSLNLLDRANAAELAHAQDNILKDGVSAGRLWQIWQNNPQFLPDQACKLRRQIPENHILRRVLAEHEMVLCFINDLENANQSIQKMFYGSSASSEIRQCGHIAGHLLAAAQHKEREEHLIMPLLREKGYGRILQLIDLQHVEINRANQRLYDVVRKVDRTEFSNFQKMLDELVRYLAPTMKIHIFVETSVLFPLALEVVKDSKAWKRIKDFSDHMGYCGYDAVTLEEKNA